MQESNRLELIQELNDRLLYLRDEQLTEFLRYLQTLYEVYPTPRVVRHGSAIFNPQKETNGA